MFYAQFLKSGRLVGPFDSVGKLHERILSSYVNHSFRIVELVPVDDAVFTSTNETWRAIGRAHREPKLLR